MPTIEMKKFDVMSVAKILAVLGAIIGFIFGLLAAAGTSAIAGMLSMIPGAAGMVGGIAIYMIVVMPIMMAIQGFIGGAIVAFLYNIVADKIGGIEFNH